MADKASLLNRRRIVLTGAWGGGKTTLLGELLNDPRYQNSMITIPEAAPLTRRMGFEPAREGFERIVLAVQHGLEDAGDNPEYFGDRRSMIAHRGSLDTLAFWRYTGRKPQDFFALTGTSLDAELARYDAVILLQSTAKEKPKAYNRYRKAKNRPALEDAIRLEGHLEEAWKNHPRFFSLPNSGLSWRDKCTLAKAVLDARIHPTPHTREEVNTHLEQITYPSSHQYSITRRGQIRPHPKAQERLNELAQVLPKQAWTSLIDVGCGKGMFLFWAIQELNLKRGIGIDAAKDMVLAGREAGDALNAPATILHGTLNGLHPALLPADLVFVFHCYHHLYFGSLFGTPARPAHAYWFALFNRITTDTLVFANTLDLPQDKRAFYKEKGFSDRIIAGYNERAILECANEHFHLQMFNLGGGRPYVVMRKKDLGDRHV